MTTQWVDMQATIASLENELRQTRNALVVAEWDRDRYKDDYFNACQTVAQMHEAAVGEITGPRRGVIEDVADVREALVWHHETLCAAAADLIECEGDLDTALGVAETAWIIICNVSDGEWTQQTWQWQDAAEMLRDRYHALLDLVKS